MASYRIEWRKSTKKDLRRISPDDVTKIIRAVESLTDDPFPIGHTKLSGTRKAARLSCGSNRDNTVPMPKSKEFVRKTFADYKGDATNWITLASGEYYPDILLDACELYKPVLVLFGQLVKTSESSTRLFLQIAEQSDGWMRVQLATTAPGFYLAQCGTTTLHWRSQKRERSW